MATLVDNEVDDVVWGSSNNDNAGNRSMNRNNVINTRVQLCRIPKELDILPPRQQVSFLCFHDCCNAPKPDEDNASRDNSRKSSTEQHSIFCSKENQKENEEVSTTSSTEEEVEEKDDDEYNHDDRIPNIIESSTATRSDADTASIVHHHRDPFQQASNLVLNVCQILLTLLITEKVIQRLVTVHYHEDRKQRKPQSGDDNHNSNDMKKKKNTTS